MLKPSDIAITGKKISIKQHKEHVVKNLINLGKNKNNKNIVAACMQIMETPSGGTVDVSSLSSSQLGEIKNFFAEVMGPIWCQEYGMIRGLSESSQTYFSSSDNERLYDFKVFKGAEEILISNKQKTGGTNTLKPGDVIKLVDASPELTKKWKKTKYYDVFEILDKSNVVSGPLKAVAECYPKFFPFISSADYKKVLSQMTQNDVIIKDLPESFRKLIMSEETASKNFIEKGGKATGTAINFLFEKVLIAISESDPSYHELFVDVTEGNILFLKFDINNRGKIYFNIEDPRKAEKRAKLRSKQGVERRSSSGRLKLDKLGFQP